MIVHGVPRRVVRKIAQRNGLVARYREGLSDVDLYPLGTKYSHVGGKHFACPHGYAAVIEQILQRDPLTTIETIITTYKGLDDFLARREETQLHLAASRYGRRRCTCTNGGVMASTLSDEPPVRASRG